MIKILQSPWVAAILGTFLYWATTVLLWHPKPQAHPTTLTRSSRMIGPSWTFQNPDLGHLVEELNQEKGRLAEKEKQLNELASRLNSERQELNQVTQAIHTMRLEFDRNVTRVEEQESANLKKLSRMYSTMTPDNATQILKQLEEPAVVKILALMKDSEAAPILEALSKQGEAEAKFAAALTERLRLAQAKPSSASVSNR